jgi:hypothetical protein
MKRKIVLFILVLVSVLILGSGCSSELTNEKISGKWELLQSEKGAFDSELISNLTLNENGSYTRAYNNIKEPNIIENNSGEYTIDGNIISLSNESTILAFKDDELTYGSGMVLVKTNGYFSKIAKSYTPPAPIEAIEPTQEELDQELKIKAERVAADKELADRIAAAAKQPTLGQENAIGKAKAYFSIMEFSHIGLIAQLEHDGFTTEEATYAADNCNTDWNEQAAKKSEAYLNIMEFSRSGLIEQLEHDGFTNEQAEYGVTQVGY